MVQSVSSPSLSRTHCFNYTLVQHAAPLSLLFLLMKNKHLWAGEKTHCVSERQKADFLRNSSACACIHTPTFAHTHTLKDRAHSQVHTAVSFPSHLCSHMNADTHRHKNAEQIHTVDQSIGYIHALLFIAIQIMLIGLVGRLIDR